jgi:hypothetical protein
MISKTINKIRFRIIANAVFEADDLDEAFQLLSIHFCNLSKGRQSLFLDSGMIEVIPLREDE